MATVLQITPDAIPPVEGGTIEGRSGTRVFTVLFNESPSDPREAGLATLGSVKVPRVNDPWPNDYWLRVTEVTPLRKTPVFWEVTCTYQTQPLEGHPYSVAMPAAGQGPGPGKGPGPFGSPGLGLGPGAVVVGVDAPQDELPPNPLSLPPVYEYDTIETMEPIEEDLKGKPFQNTAKEPFDPQPQEPVNDEVIYITRNLPEFGHATARQYRNRINASTFLDAAKETVYCKNITFSQKFSEEYGLYYYTVKAMFIYRPDGWKRRFLNQGYRYLKEVDADGYQVFENFTDSNGAPLTMPVPLDKNGGRQKAGVDPIWLEFKTKETADFTKLGLLG